MKYLFVILVFVHGLIHLFGFAKAFNLAQFEQMSLDISRIQGVAWFGVFILFAVTGEALISKADWWYWVAIITVFISTILIILNWSDAKAGAIPNLIILVVASVSLFSSAFDKKTEEEISVILNQKENVSEDIITGKELENLPIPVAKWLKKSGIVGKEKIRTVCLKQNILMKTDPDQKEWSEATAEQFFSTDNPSFVWKIDMNKPPFIRITGRDKFVNGKGDILIKMFSAWNIVHASGKKTDESVMQRFLAETVWFPSAVLSPYIEWKSIDSLSAQATMKYMGTSASGTFFFNEEGDFIAFKTLRYKDSEKDDKPREWIVEVKKHAVINGIKIPVKLEVSWMLETGKWTWLILDIEFINYNYSGYAATNQLLGRMAQAYPLPVFQTA